MSDHVIAQVGSADIKIETGKMAKQADGAITIQLGDTILLVAAVGAAKPRPGQDFFPLTVDYREKAAAAGRFPGGYFKREGRPTEKEILTCRLTDRPIRPLFPKGWMNEVQVQAVLLSADGENDPDILTINGASAALMVSDIPWAGPIGAVRLGRVHGEFIANPTHAERAESDLDLIYVGNQNEVVMFEGAAKEITEEDFKKALRAAHEAIQPLIEAQIELAKVAGRKKRVVNVSVPPADLVDSARNLLDGRIIPALVIPAKLDRDAACRELFDEISEKLVEQFGADVATDSILKETFYIIQKDAVRGLILDEEKRLDGRALDKVRPIGAEVGLLPRVHGSALFSRGETQALTLATLGASDESQNYDSYTGGITEKRFILHYNFPNFSVGETGRISGPGRREIGHGALAERSIEPMIPFAEFPYAIRIVSEVMESNGSTSMATVCGGSLALMDAGVPLIRPVAGISVGLCTEENEDGGIKRYSILTDILGSEDHYGDMDCKIAGTEEGITGFQLDLKLKGIPFDLMDESVDRARVARMHILGEMAKALEAPREEVSKYAPKILTLKINPEKIGELIGPGGKNIKRIVEESGCEINIEDDGSVNVYSVSEEGMEVAREAIEAISAEVEVGKIYRGKVVSVKDFGCFVAVLPGKEGLCHVSELANFRVKQVEDIVKEGDEIWVKCIGVDEKGRVKLSRKAAMQDRSEDHRKESREEDEELEAPVAQPRNRNRRDAKPEPVAVVEAEEDHVETEFVEDLDEDDDEILEEDFDEEDLEDFLEEVDEEDEVEVEVDEHDEDLDEDEEEFFEEDIVEEEPVREAPARPRPRGDRPQPGRDRRPRPASPAPERGESTRRGPSRPSSDERSAPRGGRRPDTRGRSDSRDDRGPQRGRGGRDERPASDRERPRDRETSRGRSQGSFSGSRDVRDGGRDGGRDESRAPRSRTPDRDRAPDRTPDRDRDRDRDRAPSRDRDRDRRPAPSDRPRSDDRPRGGERSERPRSGDRRPSGGPSRGPSRGRSRRD